MYFSETKVIPTRVNLVIVELKGVGYLYIDLPVYNLLSNNKYDDSIFLEEKNKVGIKNRELFSEVFNKYPLSVIRDYAYLIETPMQDMELIDYIDAVGYVIGNISIFNSKLSAAIDNDLFFTLPDQEEYSYIRDRFFDSCLSGDTKAGQQQSIQHVISTQEEEEEWETFCKKYGIEKYLGYGEFDTGDDEGIVAFSEEDTLKIDKYFGIDREKEKAKAEEEIRKQMENERQREFDMGTTLDITRPASINVDASSIRGDAMSAPPSYIEELMAKI